VSAGRIVLLVFGVIVLVIALGLLTAGGVVLWVDNSLKDSGGFITTSDIRLQRDSYAIVTEPAEIDLGDGWYAWGQPNPDWGDLLTVKIEGSNNDPSKGIFIGIANNSDLQEYLKGVEYDKIVDTEYDNNRWRLDYVNHPGTSAPATPASEDWTASVSGTGEQTLVWPIETGTYSAVVMNDDVSPGLDLTVRVGVKVPALFGLAVGLLVSGAVALLIGIIMVALAVRRR